MKINVLSYKSSNDETQYMFYIYEDPLFNQIIVYKSNDGQVWFSLDRIGRCLNASSEMIAFVSQHVISDANTASVRLDFKSTQLSEFFEDPIQTFINIKGIDEFIQFRKYACSPLTIQQLKKCIAGIISTTLSIDNSVVTTPVSQQEIVNKEEDCITKSIDEERTTASKENNSLPFTVKVYHHDTFGDMVTFIDSANQTWFIYIQISRMLKFKTDFHRLVHRLDIEDADKMKVDMKPYISDPQIAQIFNKNGMMGKNLIKQLISVKAILKLLSTLQSRSILKRKLDFMKWLDSLGIKLYKDGPAISEFDYMTYDHKTFRSITTLVHNTTGKVYFKAMDIVSITATRPIARGSIYVKFPFDNLQYLTEDAVDHFVSKSKHLSPSLKQELQCWINTMGSKKNQEELDHMQVHYHDTFGNLVTYKDNGKLWYLATDIARILKAKLGYVEGCIHSRINKQDGILKVDFSKFAEKFTAVSTDYHFGDRAFVLEETVARCIAHSPLDKEYKQEFAKWILSIHSLSKEEQEELSHFKIFTHDTFGTVLTYRENEKVYYFLQGVYDLFKDYSDSKRRTVMTILMRSVKTKRISISPSIILKYPDFNVGQRINDRAFIPIEALEIFNCYSTNPHKDEIYNWLITMQPNNANAYSRSDLCCYNTRVIAKDFGFSPQQLNSLLYRLGILYPLNLYPQVWGLYQKYSVMGYALTKEELIQDPISGEKKQVILVSKWTLRGRKFIHNLLAQYGIYPVDQQVQHMQSESQVPQPIPTDTVSSEDNPRVLC